MEEQKKKEKDRRKRNRLKRKLASMTAMVLAFTLAILGTMAYLSTITPTKKNTFTGSKGISLKLTETDWGTDDNNDGTFETEGEGMKAAKNYTPGTLIKKNPVLTNSTQEDGAGTEWVAIAVSYKLKDVPITGGSSDTKDYLPIKYSTMKNFIKDGSDGIAFYNLAAVNAINNDSDPANDVPDDEYWCPIDVKNYSDGTLEIGTGVGADSQAFAIYLYNKVLEKDDDTKPLFSQIKIKTQSELETGLASLNTNLNSQITGTVTFNDSRKYTVDAPAHLPNFQIDVIGAAIKNEYTHTTIVDGNSVTSPAECIDDLSATDKTQLKTDLLEILQSHIDDDVKKLNGTTP